METDFHASSRKLSPEDRERILHSFETWLDSSLADEAPPQGLAPELLSALQNGDPLPPMEGNCDLYSLWSAMIALTQEVRLQGRAFKQLHEAMTRSLEASAAENGSEAEDVADPPAEMRGATPVRKQEIDTLLDLRDRVERGKTTARSAIEELAPSRLPWLARWLGVGGRYARHTQEILAALSQGQSLTLDRLDQALLDRNVAMIACKGQIFDPQCMAAVEIEETDSVPEGTVVEVYRNGYEWEGQVYRSAQVKVARLQDRNSA
ncbi:MAG: nucleotide exchange factor GrpE [Acidobacteriaceae bacterium]